MFAVSSYFKDAESASTLSSANEYIYMTSDGKFVGLTDETMGFGFVTYDCEAGVTCPGSVASTTTKPQVFSKFEKNKYIVKNFGKISFTFFIHG